MSGQRPRVDVAAAADDLVAGLLREPSGQVSPSVYETGRLVASTPWLAGHDARVAFLAQTQRPDGAWGGPDGYALVPTLSATEAMLAILARPGSVNRAGRVAVAGAVGRGLSRLFEWLQVRVHIPIPDMPAIELIVPSLIASINEQLDRLRREPLAGLNRWWAGARLDLPAGMDTARLAGIRARLAAGEGVPDKLLHALEVAGSAARGARGVRPEASGTVGASPAATAAWLGDRAPDPADPSRRYLEEIVARSGGPVPCGLPVTVFERAWVLSALARAGGIVRRPPRRLVASLVSALEDNGTPGGAGLPADADTTAVTLFALGEVGVFGDLGCLRAYETPTHFCTWPGEQGSSTSVNAHVLEALGSHPATAEKLSRWLREQQRADGSWLDRWHASPYYATACCALALARFGGEGSAAAVRRAADWVLETQRSDGSWGHWQGTVEETSYAIQALLTTRSTEVGHVDLVAPAVARGSAFIASIDQPDHPPLWHDKDLYAPLAIIRANTLAAIQLAQRNPAVADRAQRSRSMQCTSRTA